MSELPGGGQGAGAEMTRGLYAGSVSTAQLSKLKDSGNRDETLRATAKEFTSVFIGQMMKIMDSTVDRSELTHGGEGEDIFRGMLNDEYSRSAAYNDRTGLADMVYQSLKKRSAAKALSSQRQMQEAAAANAAATGGVQTAQTAAGAMEGVK